MLKVTKEELTVTNQKLNETSQKFEETAEKLSNTANALNYTQKVIHLFIFHYNHLLKFFTFDKFLFIFILFLSAGS